MNPEQGTPERSQRLILASDGGRGNGVGRSPDGVCGSLFAVPVWGRVRGGYVRRGGRGEAVSS